LRKHIWLCNGTLPFKGFGAQKDVFGKYLYFK